MSANSLWFDPSDISTLWKDTAGTSAVTADGDAVARIDDKSGNGFHATQATLGNRYIYRTGGGKPYLENDGARFFSVPVVKATTSDWSAVAGLKQEPLVPGASYHYLLDSSAGRFILVGLEGGTNLSYYDGAAFRGAAHATTTAEVLTWVAANGTGKVRAAGADIATGLSYSTQEIAGTVTLGANNSGLSDHVTGRFYGLILVDRVMTAGEITNAEAYMAAKL